MNKEQIIFIRTYNIVLLLSLSLHCQFFFQLIAASAEGSATGNKMLMMTLTGILLIEIEVFKYLSSSYALI